MNRYASTGMDQHRTVYEVHREREGFGKPPIIETHMGLDRARIAALAYALDGPVATGDRLSGTVTIHCNFCINDRVVRSEVVDVIDERVAFRVLNELRLPKADQLGVSVEQLQKEANGLARLGI